MQQLTLPAGLPLDHSQQPQDQDQQQDPTKTDIHCWPPRFVLPQQQRAARRRSNRYGLVPHELRGYDFTFPESPGFAWLSPAAPQI